MEAINFLTVIIFVGKLQEKVPLSYDQIGRVFLISLFALVLLPTL